MTDREAVAGFAEAALAEYAWVAERVTPVRFINNAVFRVHTEPRDYALRVHRPGYRTPQQTSSELTYVEALAQASGVRVPVPLRTPSGDLISVVEVGGEARHVSVVAWLEGEVRRPGNGAGPKTLFRIGEALGRIHRFSESFEPAAGFELPTWNVANMLDEGFEPVPEVTNWSACEELRHRLIERFDKIQRRPVTYGVLHHDFILLNCLHSGREIAVIDFDDCGWGFYLQDLGGILGNLKDHRGYRSLWRSFSEGYESVRSFPAHDERDLELMVALRHCTSLLWLHALHREGGMGDDRFRAIMAYRIEEIEK